MMASDRASITDDLLRRAREEGRSALTAPESRAICAAYGIPTPEEAVATSAREAAVAASRIGYPVALKVVSPDVLHKTEAGGVLLGLRDAADVEAGFTTVLDAVRAHAPEARIDGVQVQRQVGGGVELLVGAVTDPSFGKVVAFGLGGILVEVRRDVTFRLAPVSREEAASMLDSIEGRSLLDGVRGGHPVNRQALIDVIQRVSELVVDQPHVAELDLNPLFADKSGVLAADVRVLLDFDPPEPPPRPSREEMAAVMQRIMHPRAIAVVGASAEEGKIGNSVMRNLVEGGYAGEVHPINPRGGEILGLTARASVLDVPGDVDVAIFCVPAKLVPAAMEEVGRKGIPAAVLIPSGFAETGNEPLQREVVEIARRHGVRFLGPNIYGYYYLPERLCATFCTAYDNVGPVALSSQSGGIGMAILGFARSAGVGVSSIVGLGNKADLDEDELLTFFEEDDATGCVAMHMEDLKDGRAFAEAAARISRRKPVIVLKAGRTTMGARAAGSHTGALAGDDRVYDDILRAAGVVRAPGLEEMLQFARCLPLLPDPTGENVVILTQAGGSGVLLSDACVDNGLRLMEIPQDLDQAYRRFIPPFGAAGNPIDVTGGEPPSTMRSVLDLSLGDERVHALILGYWHTRINPPAVFADVVVEAVEEWRRRGVDKPVVVSMAGDVEVEEACRTLFAHRIVAYPYTTERPVQVLGAKYRWARGAGRL
ncbi:MAG TPA: acetate--CoA ligase family protein [Candidatus Dormibacteraeota bacterium]|jgi:acyl-CoA synthetase (NDP forming)|nr:acetate--CoA ligase family protein [Candidatus Dormibacteraeota bacterium]